MSSNCQIASIRCLIASLAIMLTQLSAQAQTQQVFVGDIYNNQILRVDATTGATVGSSASAYYPSAFAYNGGYLYAAGQFAGIVTKIDPSSGSTVGVISFGSQVSQPAGVGFAPNGNIIVSDFVNQNDGSNMTGTGTGTVKEFTVNPMTGSATLVATLASGLNNPSGILVNGNTVYFTETNTGALSGGKLSSVTINPTTGLPTGSPTLLVQGTPGYTGFAGMALSGNTLYYTDLFGGGIDRYNIGTNASLAPLVSPGGLLYNQFPSGLYVDSANSILVADLGSADYPTPANGNLLRFSTTTTNDQLADLVDGIYGSAVINAVPEPGSMALCGVLAAGFAGRALRRRIR